MLSADFPGAGAGVHASQQSQQFLWKRNPQASQTACTAQAAGFTAIPLGSQVGEKVSHLAPALVQEGARGFLLPWGGQLLPRSTTLR